MGCNSEVGRNTAEDGPGAAEVGSGAELYSN